MFPSIIPIFALFLQIPLSYSLAATCRSINPFQNNYVETLIQHFDYQVCQQGCEPTINQFEDWGQKYIIDPIITSVIEKMGLPDIYTITHGVSVNTTKEVKHTCLGGNGGQSLCQDKTLDLFAKCLEKNLVRIILSDVEPYSVFISEAMCKKAKEYLEGEDLWKRVIPGYVDK